MQITRLPLFKSLRRHSGQWQTNGRFYERRGDKTVRIPDPTKPEKKKPTKRPLATPMRETRVHGQTWQTGDRHYRHENGKTSRVSTAKAKPKTLFSAVKDCGGISAAKLGTDWNVHEDFWQAGLAGLFVKDGGSGLDEIAQELVTQGHLKVPEGYNADDHLMSELKAKAKSWLHNYEAEVTETEKAYHEEMQRAYELGGTEDLIGEATRAGEEEGHRIGESEPIAEGDRGMADEEGHRGEVDFEFGANERKPTPPPPLRGVDSFGTNWGEATPEERARSAALEADKRKPKAEKPAPAAEQVTKPAESQTVQSRAESAIEHVASVFAGLPSLLGDKDALHIATVKASKELVDTVPTGEGHYAKGRMQINESTGEKKSGPLTIGTAPGKRPTKNGITRTTEDVARHEMGHKIEESIKANRPDLWSKWLDAVYETEADAYKQHKLAGSQSAGWNQPRRREDHPTKLNEDGKVSLPGIAHAIGDYAGDNAREAFSEAVSAFTHKEYGSGPGKTLPPKIDAFMKSLAAGPSPGDRNADGLVFRDGRWHAEPKPDTPKLMTAKEAAIAGKTYGEWSHAIERAFVEEKINDDHPAYIDRDNMKGGAPVFNDAKAMYGQHVYTGHGRKGPSVGKITDLSDDLKSATVTHPDGTTSTHSVASLGHLGAHLDEGYKKNRESKGNVPEPKGPHVDYMADVIDKEMTATGENISVVMRRHGIDPIKAGTLRNLVSDKRHERTKPKPPSDIRARAMEIASKKQAEEAKMSGINYANAVTIAADSVDKLRKQDVFRVLDSMQDQDSLKGMSAWLVGKRPEFKAEIDDAVKDIAEERKYPASSPLFTDPSPHAPPVARGSSPVKPYAEWLKTSGEKEGSLARMYHRNLVRDARLYNAPIPQAVLDEYPDIRDQVRGPGGRLSKPATKKALRSPLVRKGFITFDDIRRPAKEDCPVCRLCPCPHGHKWHRCPIHKNVVLGEWGGGCSCPGSGTSDELARLSLEFLERAQWEWMERMGKSKRLALASPLVRKSLADSVNSVVDGPFLKKKRPLWTPLRKSFDSASDRKLNLIADILGGVFGNRAVALFGPDKKKGWNKLDHPRGKNGRFIPKNSPEAVAAAKTAIHRVLSGRKNTETHRSLVEHLAILSVPQLHAIKREYGLSASAADKEKLVAKLADRMNRGRRTDEEAYTIVEKPIDKPSESSTIVDKPAQETGETREGEKMTHEQFRIAGNGKDFQDAVKMLKKRGGVFDSALKTWTVPVGVIDADDIRLWKLARATPAAAGYDPSRKVDFEPEHMLGGY